MGKKAEYRSAIRSRRLIRQAFVDLMKEKNLEKITVTDVVKRADINRGTFYAHYQDINAVIKQIENDLIEMLLESLGELHYNNFFQNPLPFLSKIAKYQEEDLEFYRILINSNGAEQYLVKLKDIFVNYMKNDSDIPEHIKKSPEFLISVHFVAGGVANLYQVWFRGEMDNSLTEIWSEVSKIIANGSAKFYE